MEKSPVLQGPRRSGMIGLYANAGGQRRGHSIGRLMIAALAPLASRRGGRCDLNGATDDVVGEK